MTGAFTGKMVRSMLMISIVPLVVCFFIFTGGFSYKHVLNSVSVSGEAALFNHTVNSIYSNEVGFYNKRLAHGQFNREKGMIQFMNNWTEAPRKNDIIAFDGKEGYIAIISKVGDGFVEVVQQNTYVKSSETLKFTISKGVYFIGDTDHKPLGWMRTP